MEPVTAGLIKAGVPAVTGLLDILLTMQASKEQKRESKKIRAFQRETFEKTFAEEKRATRASKKIQKQQLERQKEIDDFNKRQAFVNNFLTVLNKDPKRQQEMINLSRGRQ
jgi:uncharacterized UPF0160 family protein